MFHKNYERIIYLFLITNIFVAKHLLSFLSEFIRFLPSKKKLDIAIFLHSPSYSDGYYRRFQYYFEKFNEKKISYTLFNHFEEKHINETLSKTKKYHYKLYIKILWKRTFQILKAKNYKSIIVQRCLFPIYPDYNSPFLEKKLRKLNNNIILDIWDPIHLWNPTLTYETFRYVDKISVNVAELKETYKSQFNEKKIFIWPISVNPKLYLKKINYENNTPIKLFYTGSAGNIEMYLKPILPILEKVSENNPLELHIISSKEIKSSSIKTFNYSWSQKTLKNLISNCDYGLYPNFNDQKNFTVAGKVLDYMTTGLPIIGADYGLPKNIIAEKSIFKLNSKEDWENKFEKILSSDLNERKQKADYSKEYVTKNLSIENGFNSILKFL